jgi:hypothetical protein
VATSLVAEVISGCRFSCVVFAALDLANELFANGNKKCQDRLLWHLKTIGPMEAVKFFKTCNDAILMTADTYMECRVSREQLSLNRIDPNLSTDNPKALEDNVTSVQHALDASAAMMENTGIIDTVSTYIS